MVTLRCSTVVDAPIEVVWRLLRDFNGHEDWHPAIAESRIEGGLMGDQVGAVRRFALHDGSVLREQLLALSDRDHSFTYCILDSPLPLIDYVAQVQLKPVTDGSRTFWEWRSSFRTPPGEEEKLVGLVRQQIYEAGFSAVARRIAEAAQPTRRGPRILRQAADAPAVVGGAGIKGHAVVVSKLGGPEVLELREIEAPAPGLASCAFAKRRPASTSSMSTAVPATSPWSNRVRPLAWRRPEK